MEYVYKLIGAIIGGILGLIIPFLLMLIYAAQTDDPTAPGAFAILPVGTIPVGLWAGWKMGGFIYFIKKSRE